MTSAPERKNVVLLGKGELAIYAATWFQNSDRYQLRAIVPVIPEPTWTDSLMSWASQNGVPVVPSGHFKDLVEIINDEERVDLALSVFYDKIIRQWFIDRVDRCVNLHNGPLPHYRGVSPINWALKNGEREHGVTLHEITAGVDDGPIIAQVKYSIYPELDEVEDVYRRALAYGRTLFEQTMPILDSIKAQPQDESKALHYTKRDDAKLGDRAGFRRS